MRILRLEIEGYRSLKKQTWCPGKLNVVIGPNGSGKSNLLGVLEMLNLYWFSLTLSFDVPELAG